jgi:hypothetical protein
VIPLATCDGGSVGPNRTSYEVAPTALQVRVALVPTPFAPSAGVGDVGIPGAAIAVVNDQTLPGVEPVALRATIRQ